MKPELSNVIISKRTINVATEGGMESHVYYDVIEAGGVINPKVLNWMVHWSIESSTNLVYELDGKCHVLGSTAFKDFIRKRL